MRKIIVLITLASLTLVTSGCGSTQSAPSESYLLGHDEGVAGQSVQSGHNDGGQFLCEQALSIDALNGNNLVESEFMQGCLDGYAGK